MAAISGNLESFQLVKIFRSILDRKMTGVLTLKNGDLRRAAYFYCGHPFRVDANDEALRLGGHLVEEGLISSTELVELERDERVMGVPFARLLLDQNLVTKARIEIIEGGLARRRLQAAFGWAAGTYQFEPRDLRREEAIIEPIDPIVMIIQATAEVLPTPLCERFLRSFRGQILRPTEWLPRYAEAYDRIFPPPNLRTRLERETVEAPTVGDLPGDKARNLREGGALILAGLCTLVVDRNVKARSSAADPPPPKPPDPPMRGRQVRMRAGGPRGQRNAGRATAPRPPQRPKEATPERPAATGTVNVKPTKPRAAQGEAGGAVTKKPQVTKEMPPKMQGLYSEAVDLYETLKSKNHYELLGINNKAGTNDIRRAFRRMARDFHVDRFAPFGLAKDALLPVQQVFIAVNRAHEVLSTPADRKEYDVRLEMEAQGHKVQESGAGVQVDQAFRAEKLIRDGVALLIRGEAKAALPKLKKALESQPDDPVAKSGIAYGEYLIAQAQGGSRTMYARAKDIIDAVIADTDTRAEPFLFLGRLHRSVDALPDAARAYKKALSINPHLSEAKSDLRHVVRRFRQEDKGLLNNIFGRRKK